MKIFLFSASVFFLLGLKLILQLDILPSFNYKPATIETTTVPATKQDFQKLEVQPVIKKDTVNSTEPKSGQLTAPSLKNPKK
ncbi:MAG: hypothetical protein Q8N05_15455 [Bacteroidota bacterium]|nr:hypothetical protein [Bacteroidota bacterium]